MKQGSIRFTYDWYAQLFNELEKTYAICNYEKYTQCSRFVIIAGLGYVGLPLTVEKVTAGYKTIVFNVQKEKVGMLNCRENYIGDINE